MSGFVWRRPDRKVNAVMAAPTEAAAKQQFFTSLKRTGAEYFDYYLLHSLMDGNYTKYDRFHLWDFVQEQKAKGLIKHVGFSFHAGPELLGQILTEHPEAEFVQLQINYADWENPGVASRANYEVARKHGKPIVVMEPVKGGNLANPPGEVQKLFHDYDPDASFASWAIRFVASLPGILAVLSGMSSMEQMRDNLSYMEDFRPLTEEETALTRRAAEIINSQIAVPCTGCAYCVEGCPMRIPIPRYFSLYNEDMREDMAHKRWTINFTNYDNLAASFGRASDCIGCGQCEGVCPQHLPIIETMKKVSEHFDR